jgi:CO dehydrogenase nickel-insertion accessory protein CooC1
MKAVKKAAREEETATVIVEWRVEGRESKYLVIKRPEKGQSGCYCCLFAD